MTFSDKIKNQPRLDLRARIHAAGHRKLTTFARLKRVNVRTLYSVLDGVRATGPEAKRIIAMIEKLRAQ